MLYNCSKALLETQRKSDALRLLIEAENRFKTNPRLSQILSTKDRNKLMEEIRKQILQLKAENYKPSGEIRFR